MSPLPSRITLGTVQLGQPYGVANTCGMPGAEEAEAILDVAWGAGISSFDTALAYGDSETRIGSWIRSRGNKPYLVTKVPRMPGDVEPAGFLRLSIQRSLESLGISYIDGLLMHHADDIRRPAVIDQLEHFVAAGTIGSYGVSFCDPASALDVIRDLDIGLVQAPMNLFDRRVETSGMLRYCADAGISVYARSVFLQGLFFMSPERIPDELSSARPFLKRLEEFANETQRTLPEVAFCTIRDLPGVTSLVLGAETAAQVQQLVTMSGAPSLTSLEAEALAELASGVPDSVCRPETWGRTI